MVSFSNTIQIFDLPATNRLIRQMKACNISEIRKKCYNTKTNNNVKQCNALFPCSYAHEPVLNFLNFYRIEKNLQNMRNLRPMSSTPLVPVDDKKNLPLGTIKKGRDGQFWILIQGKRRRKWIQVEYKRTHSRHSNSNKTITYNRTNSNSNTPTSKRTKRN